MSRTLRAPERGSRAAVAGAIALFLAALAAVGLAPQANAAFTTGKCAGENIVGRGASFARDAHKVFNDTFKFSYCVGTPGAGKINVTYEAQGSGAGRQSVKIRDGAPRFGMTDEPPAPSEIVEMNSGVIIKESKNEIDKDPSNDGKIHLVPAAVGAVAPLVNFPDGCDVGLLDAASRTAEVMGGSPGSEFPLGLVRVRFTKDEFEKIWAKDATHDNWTEVFPELTSDADCNEPIVRIVRFDDSGTSFAFKDYLGTINEGRKWLDDFAATSPKKTREWPNATFGPREDCPKVKDEFPVGPGADSTEASNPGADQLTSSCFNGNQGIIDKLIATDGSVGYSDISTARNNVAQSLAIAPRSKSDAAFDNDIYWTQVPSGPGAGAFEEPTADPDGFRTDGSPGSNCGAAQFENKAGGGLPSTLGDWSKVSGVNSAGAYAICTLTYGLVFDDNADVWGNTPDEETKARTVKDYWENILSNPAQVPNLFSKDYSPLPTQILNIAKAGIASVDWNKGEGGGGGEKGGNDDDGKKDSGGTVTPPPPAKPSNAFSLLRKSISSKTGGATLSLKLPGAGKLEVVATANVSNGRKGRKKRRLAAITVARVTLSASKGGTFNVPLRPSGAAKKALRKKGKLTVKLALTFTPTGGDAKQTTSTLVLKLKKAGK